MNGDSYGRWVGSPATGPERGCLISSRDWELLLQSSEIVRERGYRNLCFGVAASGAFGILSTVSSSFSQMLSVGVAPLQAFFLIVMISGTIATAALGLFFHRRVADCGADGAVRRLDEAIRSQLEDPGDPDDPRRWP